MTSPRFTLVVDPVSCDGAGVCAELFPECIDLDPWGFPIVRPGGIPAHLVDHAQRAVSNCPRMALILARTES